MTLPISIRPFRSTDLESLWEALAESKGELIPWMPWCHEGYGREETSAWLGSRQSAWERDESCDFAIVGPGDRIVGACGIHRIDMVQHTAEVGYWVRTSVCGRGVATAAARQLCAWAYHERGLRRLEILVATGNKGSQQVALKLGAQREGVLRKRLEVQGELLDCVVFGLLRGELT